MPARPAWISRVNEICAELELLPRPFVDRATLKSLLQVGRRRAQQILAPCVSNRIGSNGLADRDAVIRRLRGIAAGEDEQFEMERRRKLADLIEKLRRERIESPQILVEAPVRVLGQQLWNLCPKAFRSRPGGSPWSLPSPDGRWKNCSPSSWPLATITKHSKISPAVAQ